HRLWNKLVEPPDHIPISQRRHAQLLSAFLVAIIALGAVYELSYLWFGPTSSSFLIEVGISFGTLIVLGAIYGLCRAGHVVLSAALTVAIMSLGVYAIVFIAIEDPNMVHMLNFLVIPLLIGNIFFGGKRILLTVAIYSIGIFALPVFLPGVKPNDLIVGPVSFLWITACIIVITNRHRDQVERDRQRDLVTSERRFRALIEHIGDGIELIDARSRVRYISPSAQRILGYTLADYEGDTGLELIHPDDRAAAVATMDLVVRSPGQPIHAAYRLRHREGVWRWIEGTLANFLDDPAVGNIVVTFRDVTERKQRERELETIATISAALRTVPNRAGVLPVVLDQAMALLNARGAALVLRDPAHDHTGVELGRGVWAHTTGRPIPAGEGITDQVMGTNQPYLSNDAWSDASFGSAQAHGGLHIAVVPLAAQEYVIGALWMGLTDSVTENDVRLLTAIADIAASAIHRVTLFEQTEQRLHRLTALRAIDTAITASLDLRLALDILLEQVTTQLGIDAAGVLLLDPHLKVLQFAAGRGFRSRTIERSRARLGQGYAGSAALERRTIAIPNLREAEGFDRASILEGEGFATYFGVPLIAKGDVKGVLEVFHRTPVTPDADWQDFLDLLARQVAIAIDNAELFEDLQRSNQELILAYADRLSTPGAGHPLLPS
ncbi:MAG: GAF domain-containing protein, partial [Chloroflexi bacterium]|nr:GAF domain-containing protein [Chloroflexota bacterium]